MTALLRTMLRRITPPMLRSNSPDRPIVTRRRHWFLQETRFLFLTRKGPVEIIVKPALIMGIAFIGLVGTGVTLAATLFVGYKSVEVVTNESITPAVASAPQTIIDEDMEANLVAADIPATNPQQGTDEGTRLAMAMTPPPRWPASLAATDAVAPFMIPDRTQNSQHVPPLAENLAEPDIMISVPSHPETEINPGALAGTHSALVNPAPRSGAIAENQITDIELLVPPAAGMINEIETVAMNAPPSAPVEIPGFEIPGPEIPGPEIPGAEGPAMEPLHPDSHLPVFTDESRQRKLLRSMAREIRGIRQSLSDLGLPETAMPDINDLRSQVETADFASLAMAVEDHRSMLRKVPLKPPMLYFYISSNYGYRNHPVLKKKRFHHGIDLAGTWQETVHAPAPGTVIFAGRKGSFGNVVQIRHAYGIVTTYAHLAKVTIRKGADVVPGTVIGKMGRTGRVEGAHLHYEIRLGDKSFDPQMFFDIGHRIGVGGELMLAAEQQ